MFLCGLYRPSFERERESRKSKEIKNTMKSASASQGKSGEQKKTAPIKFKADIERGVVITTFERNGWVKTEGDDWTIGWFNVGNIRAMFHPDTSIRLTDNQMVNHYPNHYELTRKVSVVWLFRSHSSPCIYVDIRY